MTIETADEAAEAFKSFDDWQYADREAVWEWMFEQGRIAEREACRLRCKKLLRHLNQPHRKRSNHG